MTLKKNTLSEGVAFNDRPLPGSTKVRLEAACFIEGATWLLYYLDSYMSGVPTNLVPRILAEARERYPFIPQPAPTKRPKLGYD